MNTQALMRGAEAYTSHAEVADAAYSESPAWTTPFAASVSAAVSITAGTYTSGVTVGATIEASIHVC